MDAAPQRGRIDSVPLFVLWRCLQVLSSPCCEDGTFPYMLAVQIYVLFDMPISPNHFVHLSSCKADLSLTVTEAATEPIDVFSEPETREKV